ncbi:MAG TPA: hypothetical protein VGF75_06385 [Candidatus Saccharimonadales bacterium]|jgi:hypothetical protein
MTEANQQELGNWQRIAEAARQLYAADEYAGRCVLAFLATSTDPNHQLAAIDVFADVPEELKNPVMEQSVKILEENTEYTESSVLMQMVLMSAEKYPAPDPNHRRSRHTTNKNPRKHSAGRYSNVIT